MAFSQEIIGSETHGNPSSHMGLINADLLPTTFLPEAGSLHQIQSGSLNGSNACLFPAVSVTCCLSDRSLQKQTLGQSKVLWDHTIRHPTLKGDAYCLRNSWGGLTKTYCGSTWASCLEVRQFCRNMLGRMGVTYCFNIVYATADMTSTYCTTMHPVPHTNAPNDPSPLPHDNHPAISSHIVTSPYVPQVRATTRMRKSVLSILASN